MLRTLTNLTKAVAAVVATPVAILADVVTLPASSWDPHRGPFDRTGSHAYRCRPLLQGSRHTGEVP